MPAVHVPRRLFIFLSGDFFHEFSAITLGVTGEVAHKQILKVRIVVSMHQYFFLPPREIANSSQILIGSLHVNQVTCMGRI